MAEAQPSATKRIIFQTLVGALFGGAGVTAVLLLTDGRYLDVSDPSTALAVVAGTTYLMLGLLVGLGTAAPKPGARFLNVEDETEIVEERPKLAGSSLGFMLMGAFLLALATGGALVEALGRTGAIILFVGLAGAAVLVSLPAARAMDELTRQISHEAASMTLNFVIAGLVIAAIAQAAGLAVALSPLALISGLAFLYLGVVFWVSGKRGMLTPRNRV